MFAKLKIKTFFQIFRFYGCFESIERYAADISQFTQDLEEGKFIQESVGKLSDNIIDPRQTNTRHDKNLDRQTLNTTTQ